MSYLISPTHSTLSQNPGLVPYNLWFPERQLQVIPTELAWEMKGRQGF